MSGPEDWPFSNVPVGWLCSRCEVFEVGTSSCWSCERSDALVRVPLATFSAGAELYVKAVNRAR